MFCLRALYFLKEIDSSFFDVDSTDADASIDRGAQQSYQLCPSLVYISFLSLFFPVFLSFLSLVFFFRSLFFIIFSIFLSLLAVTPWARAGRNMTQTQPPSV